jgi:hypothetical protein
MVLSGCDCRRSLCVSNIGKAVPAYQLWEKSRESDLDVLKAYLECGGEYPYVGSPKNPDDIVFTYVCLENSGYMKVSYLDRQPTCSKEYNKGSPACQPGAVIPTPSVERRLNGSYCKKDWNRNKRECQP